ncbi:Hypothetical predicted protein [Podarcis lilfordi]|uniref:Uncharacterized protein n=1 Tax=Podarcis lilfordi TaxID=74358 RepID=A0AA35PKW2_9SAUR|nr:Hypothetical predicted protein [Podarcis lilfordi]
MDSSPFSSFWKSFLLRRKRLLPSIVLTNESKGPGITDQRELVRHENWSGFLFIYKQTLSIGEQREPGREDVEIEDLTSKVAAKAMNSRWEGTATATTIGRTVQIRGCGSNGRGYIVLFAPTLHPLETGLYKHDHEKPIILSSTSALCKDVETAQTAEAATIAGKREGRGRLLRLRPCREQQQRRLFCHLAVEVLKSHGWRWRNRDLCDRSGALQPLQFDRRSETREFCNPPL